MEKKMYWIKDLTENQVIHAPTKKTAKKLCKMFRELGLKWRDRYPHVKETYWTIYGVKTCYRPSTGDFCNISYYIESNHEILTIDQLWDFNRITNEQADKLTELMKDCLTHNKSTSYSCMLDQNFLESAEYYAQISQTWLDKLPESERYKRVKDLARQFHGAIVDELCVNGFKNGK